MARVDLSGLTRVGFFSGGYPDDRSLPSAQSCVVADWCSEERERAAAYLDGGELVASYRGFSACRICGKPNGSGERSDGEFLWPTGYSHYVRDHSVRPTAALLASVLCSGS